LDNLEKHINRSALDVHEITSKFIQGCIEWIMEQAAPSGRKKGERAASLYPSSIRALHNRAKQEFNNEDEGIIRIPLSPFSKIKLPSMPKVRKHALSPEKIKQISDLPYQKELNTGTANRFNIAKDVFMLSFCLWGINSIDLYYCDKLKDGRLIYTQMSATAGTMFHKVKFGLCKAFCVVL
jgi:hypothetical protein